MINITGILSTGILAALIIFLTIRGFRREIKNIRNGSCCSSDSCACGCQCRANCSHGQKSK